MGDDMAIIGKVFQTQMPFVQRGAAFLLVLM
jgi:hypothetical protein